MIFYLDEDLLEHEIYYRPWGFYKTIFLNPHSQSKSIKIKSLGEINLQEHKRREEYWVITHGIGKVVAGESKKRVELGSYVYLLKGCIHKLIKSSKDSSLMEAEVQPRDYFSEDDIIRYQDIYGRN